MSNPNNFKEIEGKESSAVEVRLGRYQEVLSDIADGSVAVVVTDPDWRWHQAEWAELGAFCKRILRPGGVLVVYPGPLHLDEAVCGIRQHLNHFWTGALPYRGRRPIFRSLNVEIGWTPLLFFAKGEYEPRGQPLCDSLPSPSEKVWHPWQKPLPHVRYYVEYFTGGPDDLVVDPCLGGGTTAVAALQLGRRFIGCDVDPEAVERTRARLAEEPQPEPPEPTEGAAVVRLPPPSDDPAAA